MGRRVTRKAVGKATMRRAELGGCRLLPEKAIPHPSDRTVPPPTNEFLPSPAETTPTLSPQPQKPHAHDDRLNAHTAHSDRNLPTERHPSLRIRRRNSSSWRRSPCERGPKRSRLTQLRCRWSFDQDRWDDWVLWYVPSFSPSHPRFAYIHGLSEIGITLLAGFGTLELRVNRCYGCYIRFDGIGGG